MKISKNLVRTDFVGAKIEEILNSYAATGWKQPATDPLTFSTEKSVEYLSDTQLKESIKEVLPLQYIKGEEVKKIEKKDIDAFFSNLSIFFDKVFEDKNAVLIDGHTRLIAGAFIFHVENNAVKMTVEKIKLGGIPLAVAQHRANQKDIGFSRSQINQAVIAGFSALKPKNEAALRGEPYLLKRGTDQAAAFGIVLYDASPEMFKELNEKIPFSSRWARLSGALINLADHRKHDKDFPRFLPGKTCLKDLTDCFKSKKEKDEEKKGKVYTNVFQEIGDKEEIRLKIQSDFFLLLNKYGYAATIDALGAYRGLTTYIPAEKTE